MQKARRCNVRVSRIPQKETIAAYLEEILNSGVKKMVVQGQFPMGCLSIYLKVLGNTQHDEHGCVAAVTSLSDKHNQLLKEVIANAAKNHLDAEIIYFDTSAAYLHILDNAAAYDFTNVDDPCYAGDATCPNPQNYMSWDGIHLTDSMYGALMKLFLTNSKFSSPFPNFITSAISACNS